MTRGFGDNSEQALPLSVTLKLFNSLAPFAGGSGPVDLALPPGAVVGDLVRRFQIPAERIYLVLVNGQDITRRPGLVNLERPLEDGDVVALSGPVPYSWAYGAPIV